MSFACVVCSAIIACGSDHAPPSAPDADIEPDELPCDVRAVLETTCTHCHSSPPTSNALQSLVSRWDFLGPSSIEGETIAMRALARLGDPLKPMPPASEPPIAASQRATLVTWLAGGIPAGTCGKIPAGYVVPTCASGMIWDQGDTGGAPMNPGQACVACHQSSVPQFAYFFEGTVFSAFHEGDNCESPPPANARIEILDVAGAVTLSLLPTPDGNFMSSGIPAGVPLPYRARLIANGSARAMTSLQMTGDCNGCHTDQGVNPTPDSPLPPGRLVWPPLPAT